jgi:hypothetical protein
MRASKFVFGAFVATLSLGPFASPASDMSAISAGAVELHGEFVEGGVECPLFLVDDGRTFALEGIDLALVKIGATARLWGQESMMSTCQQGSAFSVVRVEIDAP